jgi:hypothetical protein
MGWERRGGRDYYYRASWSGGRVVKEYVGTGRVAELVADMDAIERAGREADRQADRETRRELAALDAPLAELDELADLLARAALLAAGLRQHRRGEWRRPRARTDQQPARGGGPADPR